MLINPGIFWDDWGLYEMSDKGIMSQYYGNGIIVFGYIHLFLKSLGGSPFLYHLLTFLLQLLSIFTLFRITDRVTTKGNHRIFLFFSVLFFAIFPYYDSKITMIVFPYTLCLTLFVVATYFLFRFRESKGIGYRLLSLLFYFLSFFTNSLLFFYILPLFFAFFYTSFTYPFRLENVKNWFFIILKRIDFFLLPIAFWIMRLNFFMPSQQYEALGYNEVNLETLLQIPYRTAVLLKIFVTDLFPFVTESLEYPELWILFAATAIGIYSALSKIDLKVKVSWKMLAWGIIIFFAGAFPYLMVNKYPTYIDYMSRHQLLIGFGASLSFCALIFLLKSPLAKRVLLSGSIAAFICLNVFIQFSFFKGYVKQEVFRDYFAAENISSQSSQTILLEDATVDFTQKGNPVKFYAFAGMLKQQNEKENILIIEKRTLDKFLEIDLFNTIAPYNYQYNLSDYEYTNPDQKLVVNYSEKERPLFPIFTYYGHFITGNKSEWNEYFNFRIEPLQQDE